MNGQVALTATAVGIDLSRYIPLNYESWLAHGERLYASYKSLQWSIGDWLNYGEAHYGEMYTQALEIFPEHAYSTMANYKYVASRVEFYRRRENLSWSHHSEVAPLEPDEQTEWLDKAENEHWTKAELSQALLTAGMKARRAPSVDELNHLPTPPLIGSLTTIRDAIDDIRHRPDLPGFAVNGLELISISLNSVLELLRTERAGA